MRLTEYFKKDDTYYRRELVEGFVLWYRYNPSTKKWVSDNNLKDDRFQVKHISSEGDMFLDFL